MIKKTNRQVSKIFRFRSLPRFSSGAGPLQQIECYHCNAPFVDLQAMLDHIGKDHPKNKKCKYCSLVSRTYADLAVHVKIAHARVSSPWEHSYCADLRLQEKSSLICNVKQVLQKKGLIIQPKKTQSLLLGLKPIHPAISGIGNLIPDETPAIQIDPVVAKENPPQVWTCDLCDQTFSFEILLQTHRQTHVCSVCNLAFVKFATLSNHLLVVHKIKKPHICGTCGQSFTSTAELAHHEYQHKDKSSNYNECDECGYFFATKSSLARHKTVHKS